MTKPDETPKAAPAATPPQPDNPGRAGAPSPREAIKGDAAGQFAPKQSGSRNNGLDSAVPRVTGQSESIAKAWDEDYEEPDASLPNRPR